MFVVREVMFEWLGYKLNCSSIIQPDSKTPNQMLFIKIQYSFSKIIIKDI